MDRLRRGKAAGVGVSGLGGVLPGIDTQFLHARDESRAVDAHAGCGPIGSPNTAIPLGEARTISSRYLWAYSSVCLFPFRAAFPSRYVRCLRVCWFTVKCREPLPRRPQAA